MVVPSAGSEITDREARRAARPSRAAPIAAVVLGAGDGVLLLVLAALTAGDLDAPTTIDAVSVAVAVLSGLMLLAGAASLLMRMPIGRLLLVTTAATVAAGVVTLLFVEPSGSGRLVDVVTGALLVAVQTSIVLLAASWSTLLWLVGAPGVRRRR